MSLTAKNPFPTKEHERLYQWLDDAYHDEEFAKVPILAREAWDKAYAIYQASEDKKPFYILLMVMPVHARAQTHLCQFAKLSNPKKEKQCGPIKNCLVWFCDKRRGVFALAKELCDLSQPQGWGRLNPPSTDERLELS